MALRYVAAADVVIREAAVSGVRCAMCCNQGPASGRRLHSGITLPAAGTALPMSCVADCVVFPLEMLARCRHSPAVQYLNAERFC